MSSCVPLHVPFCPLIAPHSFLCRFGAMRLLVVSFYFKSHHFRPCISWADDPTVTFFLSIKNLNIRKLIFLPVLSAGHPFLVIIICFLASAGTSAGCGILWNWSDSDKHYFIFACSCRLTGSPIVIMVSCKMVNHDYLETDGYSPDMTWKRTHIAVLERYRLSLMKVNSRNADLGGERHSTSRREYTVQIQNKYN